MLRQTLAQRGVTGLYSGVTAVILGNAVKAGVRFTTYDQFKSMLRDDEVSPPFPPFIRYPLAFVYARMPEAGDHVMASRLMGDRANYQLRGRCWLVLELG